jgi:hypothetical protein
MVRVKRPIPSANSFIYIENQYFYGSSQYWIGSSDGAYNVECKHRPIPLPSQVGREKGMRRGRGEQATGMPSIPFEIVMRIVSKIRQGERCGPGEGP